MRLKYGNQLDSVLERGSASHPASCSAQPWSHGNRNQKFYCTNYGPERRTARRFGDLDINNQRLPLPSCHREKDMESTKVNAFVGELSNSPPQRNTPVLSDGDFTCLINKIINTNYRLRFLLGLLTWLPHAYLTFKRSILEYSVMTGSEVEDGTKSKAKVCGRSDAQLAVPIGRNICNS